MAAAVSRWSLAYAYAAAMAELDAERDRNNPRAAGRDYAAAQVMIARAITIDADRAGLRVTSVDDFGSLSLVALYTDGLHPLNAVLDFVQSGLGSVPEPDEPGFDAFTALQKVTEAHGATVEDLVRDNDLSQQVQDEVDHGWMANIEIAQRLVMVTVSTVGTSLHGPVLLAALADRAHRHVPAAH